MDIKDSMEKLFFPKSVALIEASERRTWQVMGLTERDYEGKIYLVTEKHDELFGIRCFSDISQLPDEIDHCILAINRNRLLEIIEKCIQKKFHTIHIFSSGGAEQDEYGVKLERKIYDLLKKNKTRAIGPNCMGVYSPEGRISYSPLFLKEPVGNIAVISHSGDLTTRYVLLENDYGVRFSKVASIGNSVDLHISDFIDYLDSDEKTDLICIYFEGFSRYEEDDGRKLWKSLRSCKKPVLFLRGGMTEPGKRAVSSHTGTIASNSNVWDALFKQTGAIEVQTYEDLIDATIAFYFCKDLLPKTKKVAILTWSGGTAVLSTDQVIQAGLKVPQIKEPTLSKLKELITFGSGSNPLDIPWIWRRDKFAEIGRLAVTDDYIGGLILETGAPTKFDERFELTFQNLIKIYESCKQIGKPFLISLPYSHIPAQRDEYKDKLINIGIPVFPTILRASKAYLNLFKIRAKA